jgi:hypothetical protein
MATPHAFFSLRCLNRLLGSEFFPICFVMICLFFCLPVFVMFFFVLLFTWFCYDLFVLLFTWMRSQEDSDPESPEEMLPDGDSVDRSKDLENARWTLMDVPFGTFRVRL